MPFISTHKIVTTFINKIALNDIKIVVNENINY
ncbi:MAG: hypothetical protein JWR38_1181 [Mucilaginibacter sp.]|nr:hypothetical protein [Mucilaginibacter sp.]